MFQAQLNLKNKKLVYLCGFLILAVFILVFIYYNEMKLVYSSPQTVKQFILDLGILAPITFILIQVSLFFIPCSFFTISGGYIFGVFFGTIYSLIAIMISSIAVFYISRKLGRPFAKKLINKKELNHFDVFLKKRGKISLFVARSVPMLFPLHVVSFAAGLTPLRLKDFALFSFLGFVPNLFILAYFGEQLSKGINVVTLIILLVLGIAVLVYLFRHQIKIFFIKEIGDYEKKISTIEVKSLKEINNLEKDIRYEFHKWKNQLLIADKIISILVVLFLGLFSPDYVLISAYLLLIPYLMLTKRRTLFHHLIVSSALAFIWVLIAKNQYAYNQNFLTFMGISLFPLFSWGLGFFLVYLIYSHYEYILKKQEFIWKLLFFAAFYITFLITVETIAYHLFNIHNLATAEYPGLPICNCIHAPPWMQVSYFAMGPVFFTICYILKLENPHYKIYDRSRETI